MYIERLDSERIAVHEIDQLGRDLLLEIPRYARTDDNPAARERLFSRPVSNPDPEFEKDWEEYVAPELRAAFEDALTLVERDLKQLRRGEPPLEMCIPFEHLEAWVHSMNQARLALFARHSMSDEEMERDGLPEPDERAVAMLHMRFYGLLMEVFLRHLEHPGPFEEDGFE